jgi:hypothetical protein
VWWTSQALAKAKLDEEEQEDSDDWEAAALQRSWEEPRERWDCESVLSKLSTADNHPGRISDPGKWSSTIPGFIK